MDYSFWQWIKLMIRIVGALGIALWTWTFVVGILYLGYQILRRRKG